MSADNKETNCVAVARQTWETMKARGMQYDDAIVVCGILIHALSEKSGEPETVIMRLVTGCLHQLKGGQP